MSDGYPYLAGLLLQMTCDLLERIEACEHHDQWRVSRDRAHLERIKRVINTPGWTHEDVRAVVLGQVAA